MVLEIGLSGSWRDHLAPHALGPAVVEAANAATGQRVMAWAESIATSAGPDTRSARDGDPATPDPVRPVLNPLFGKSVSGRQILNLLDGVEAELDRFQQEIGQRLRQGSEGCSDGGHVTAVVRNGQLSGVELDLRWAAGVRYTEIAREIRIALQEAQAADQRSKPSPGDVSNSLRELQTLFGDFFGTNSHGGSI